MRRGLRPVIYDPRRGDMRAVVNVIPDPADWRDTGRADQESPERPGRN